jgi:hypothetical protein
MLSHNELSTVAENSWSVVNVEKSSKMRLVTIPNQMLIHEFVHYGSGKAIVSER